MEIRKDKHTVYPRQCIFRLLLDGHNPHAGECIFRF